MNGTPTTVIGVMAQGFSFPQNQDLWVPLSPSPDLENRQTPIWFVFGRLNDSATIDSARAEMEVIGRRLASADPVTNEGVVPRLRSFAEFFIGPRAGAIYEAMWAAVGFVLLIACANLANLMLARAISRSHEVAVRVALGAGRWQIVSTGADRERAALGHRRRHRLVDRAVGRPESTLELTASPSGQVGGSYFDSVLDYSMDGHVLLYVSAISIGAGVLFGLARRRCGFHDSIACPREVPASGHDQRTRRWAAYLIVAEVALAVVLLAGAGGADSQLPGTFTRPTSVSGPTKC